jgi:hypothetical protein
MRVPCEIRAVTLANENTGRPQPGVEATCTECGHVTRSFGESAASVRRCLALMRDQCPRNDHNYYVTEDDDD